MNPNPIFSIWTSPRETIRRIVDINPAYLVILLACLAGIDESLTRASTRNMGDRFSISTILLIALILGPLGGLFTIWLSSHLLRWTGKWLGGLADRDYLKAALAWAYVPSIFILPLWIPKLSLFGSELFTKAIPRIEASSTLTLASLGFSIIEMVLGIWTFVLTCNTIAEVQGYRSAWRGLLNIILAGAVIAIPLGIFVAVIFFSTR